MKKYLIAILFILAFALPAFAKAPSIQIETNKEAYTAGENGSLTIKIENLAEKDTTIEAEILSPEGKLVYGAILYTNFPAKTILNPSEASTEQVIYQEDINFLLEGTKTRNIEFEIPKDVPTGEYTINVRLSTPTYYLIETKKINISSMGNFLDVIPIIYIGMLAFSIYLIRGAKS